jgi:signal peptidase I
MNRHRKLRRVLLGIGGLALLVWLSGVRLFAFAGDSMVPTVHGGERMLGLVGPWGWRTPKRFDLVIFDVPPASKWAGKGIPWMKRLIGLPNENVRLVGRQVWIDGRLIDAPFLHVDSSVSERREFEVKLGPGQYFVLGDNLDHTLEDSRVLGPIAREAIRGFVAHVFSQAPRRQPDAEAQRKAAP